MLPSDPKARKGLPVFTGVIQYFPDVWAEIAKVSLAGNKQHIPGTPLHWERGLSVDQMDAALRHMIDHCAGSPQEADGTYHLAKAIWRLCAELQLCIEVDQQREAAQVQHEMLTPEDVQAEYARRCAKL